MPSLLDYRKVKTALWLRLASLPINDEGAYLTNPPKRQPNPHGQRHRG